MESIHTKRALTDRNAITPLVKSPYEFYFGFSINGRGKNCMPKFWSSSCWRIFRGSSKLSLKIMPFTKPII